MTRRRTVLGLVGLALLAIAAAALGSSRVSGEWKRFRKLANSGWTTVRVLDAAHPEVVSFDSGGINLVADLRPGLPGSGCLLLLHGSSVHGRRLPLIQVLGEALRRRGWTVLSPDLRAYGDSDDPPAPRSADDFDFASDVAASAAFLERKGLCPAGVDAVVGHSFGGGVALHAASRPGGPRSLVLIGPPRRLRERFFAPKAPDRAYFLERWRRDMRLESPLDPDLWDEVYRPLDIQAYVERPERLAHARVFLVDGEQEDLRDLAFLGEVARRSPFVSGRWTVPATNHYLSCDTLLGRVAYNAAIIGPVADRIDSWLRHPEETP